MAEGDSILRITKKSRQNLDLIGADDRIRTGDLILTKDALYLLSYTSMLCLLGAATFVIIARYL